MKNRGYYDVFVKTCAKYPSNIAIRYYDGNKYKHFTYSELYGVCEYITQNLQQLQCNRGIIGVVSDRNIIIPCVIAAAHKCCTTFMFLDPAQNIEHIAKELHFAAVLTINYTDQNYRNLFDKRPERTVTLFNLEINFFKCTLIKNLHKKFIPQHSFITMTSGSTGEPKHIQVPIQCLQPNIDDLTNIFNITSEDVIYFSTPLTFDPSMVEILLACLNGASLLIAPENIDIMFPLNRENSITFWQTTPSKFLQFSNDDIMNKILCANSTLKILALGGEPLNSVKRLALLKSRQNKTRIFNLYGVSEMSCWACVSELNVHTITNDREIPLGDCLSETQVVVDIKNKNTGKIILMSNTRNCYLLNKCMANADSCMKYVDTGDIGEVKSGTIYYRGRTNDTIKRFGCKVNLQVIESTVMQCTRVKTCACLWLPKPLLLVIYFSSDNLSCQELSDFLKCKLEDKYWPDNIIRVNHLPTNNHGKVTKYELNRIFETSAPKPQSADSLLVYLLSELRATLNKSLVYDEVKDNSFFSLGGTSVLALLMCNRISLTYPALGTLLLPYLLTHNNTIGEIIEIAESKILSVNAKSNKCLKICHVSDNVLPQSSIETNGALLSKQYINKTEFTTMWTYNTGKCVDASPILFRSGFNLYVTVGSHSGKVVVLNARNGELFGMIVLKSRIEAPVLYTDYQDAPRGVVGTYNGTLVCFSLDNVKILWKIYIESMIKSKAVCKDRYLYVASYDGQVRCIDITNGAILQTIHVCEQGISADLVLAKNKYILVGSLLGMCVCIDGDTNTIAWRTSLTSPIFASPVLYDEDKYVIFAEVNGQIHCRTVERGITIWTYQGVKGNVFSSLCVMKINKYRWQIVFGCHDTNVYSICVKNYIPTLYWKAKLNSSVYSTPCTLGKDCILAASNVGNLYIINSENGAIMAEHQLASEVFSSPAVFGEYIFIGCRDDRLHSIRYTMKNDE